MNDVVYISFMCIGNEYQSQGYGREVINQFIIELVGQNYNEIRVNVSLKNWPCLLLYTGIKNTQKVLTRTWNYLDFLSKIPVCCDEWEEVDGG
jgi:ribosomal protein S18 acetylase RimI-like enzyme